MAAEKVWKDGEGLGGEDRGWKGEDHGGAVGAAAIVGVLPSVPVS